VRVTIDHQEKSGFFRTKHVVRLSIALTDDERATLDKRRLWKVVLIEEPIHDEYEAEDGPMSRLTTVVQFVSGSFHRTFRTPGEALKFENQLRNAFAPSETAHRRQ
jgi:hypothetical protein